VSTKRSGLSAKRRRFERQNEAHSAPKLDTKDWHAARKTVEQWLEWGQPSEPLPDSELLNRLDVSIDQAVKFWFSFSAETHTTGGSTREKYEVLLNKRLKTWATEKRKRFIRDFDDPILVKQFFMSWRNLQPTRNKKQATNLDKALAVPAKRAELERLRRFSIPASKTGGSGNASATLQCSGLKISWQSNS